MTYTGFESNGYDEDATSFFKISATALQQK
jgi:hypothetical protein